MRTSRHLFSTLLSLTFVVASSGIAAAQYTPSAGRNAPAAAYEAEQDSDGQVRIRKVKTQVRRDSHGNASGNQYDLAIDGAFEGQTVLILDQVGNTLINTRAALKEKGLSSVVYANGHTPSVKELRKALAKSCQVWLISGSQELLTDKHIAVIKKFFDAGHGVYIWGDNDPLYHDANRLASALVPGLRMKGNLYGNKVVGIAEKGTAGVRKGHLITTGLEHLYEGVTIATPHFGSSSQYKHASLYNQAEVEQYLPAWTPELPDGFTPLLHGSAGNMVSAAYDKDGKRLVIDGGFTRLAVSWDDAGTARYVKNAASWLVNAERFANKVANKGGLQIAK